MQKNITFYVALTGILFLFAIFVSIFPTFIFYLLLLFFSLVIAERFLKKDRRFLPLSITRNKVNKYYRRVILYPWLAFCFIGSLAQMDKLKENNTQIVSQTNAADIKQNKSNKISTPKKVNTKPIENEIFFTRMDEKRQVKYGKYNLIESWISAKKEGNYSVNQIKNVLKKEVENLKSEESNSDYISVYFFERRVDYDNGQPYTLGMVGHPAGGDGWIRCKHTG